MAVASIDYSGVHAFVYGVETATYKGADGITVTASAKVKKIEFNIAALSGSNFDVEANDQAFAMWSANMGSTIPETSGSITIGSDVWNILQVRDRGDGDQWFVLARKE